MDISIAGNDHDLFQYMVNHGNSWIAEENIMASSNLLVSSYLTSQENIREVIKIEDMFPISGDDPSFSGAMEDAKKMFIPLMEKNI